MSHTLARPLVRDLRLLRQESTRAFTLIELLTVIAIIAILTAITFGVIKGANQRAAIGQTKVELSALAQALEQYKQQYGDYPQNPSVANLLQSLIGKIGPTGLPMIGKNFLDLSKFTTSADPTIAANAATATLQDPWGRNYIYYYKAPTGTWTTYVLFSSGPDGLFTQPNSSTDLQQAAANNLDNIYSAQ